MYIYAVYGDTDACRYDKFRKMLAKRPPRKINDLYGYRTAMSMKSQETWDFAHRYCGRIWLWSGAGILLLSVIAMVIFRGDFYTAGAGLSACRHW